MYLFFKVLHVFLASLAIGLTSSYGLWFKLAQKDPKHYGFILRGVVFLDSRVANPCFIGLGISGLLMVYLSSLPWSTTWIAASLAIFCILYVLGLTVMSPIVKRQLVIYEAKGEAGTEDPEFLALTKRGQKMGPVMGLGVLALIYLMVVKPG